MEERQFSARVNGRIDLGILPEEPLDLIPDGEGGYHLIHNRKSYQVKLEEADYTAKTIDVVLNDKRYTIELFDQYDRLVDEMGLDVAQAHLVKDIHAPMPGLVLDIQVKVGQTVAEGDTLLILEAMKMENAIQAPGEGVIADILVQKSQPVDKGELLITFE